MQTEPTFRPITGRLALNQFCNRRGYSFDLEVAEVVEGRVRGGGVKGFGIGLAAFMACFILGILLTATDLSLILFLGKLKLVEKLLHYRKD